jgi:hypothetical protein
MRKQTIVVLFLLAGLILGCSPTPEPQATASAEPTEVPTSEPTPEPTDTIERIESGFYTRSENGWQVVYEDEMIMPIILPEEMTGGDLDFFQVMQYGYFKIFQADNDILSAYIEVPPGGIYRVLDFAVSSDQTVICLPPTVGDRTPVENIKFKPDNSKVNFPPGPGNKTLFDLLPNLSDGIYTVIVIKDTFTPKAVSTISQIAMLCP